MVAVAIVTTAACATAADSTAPALALTEVAAAGIPDDWVEVLNVSDEPVELVDFVVVDERGRLDRARPLGATTLAPGERQVCAIDDATTGFRLAGDEEVWIYRAADGALVDGVDWAQGASPPGGSLARRGDSGGFATITTDSRGAANPGVP